MWKAAIAWLILFQVQEGETAEAIRLLKSDLPEDRARAGVLIKSIGRPALPGLKELANARDNEVALRAQFLIRVITIQGSLTPRLRKALPGIEDQLAFDDKGAWFRAFLHASELAGGRPAHGELIDSDFAPLLRRASEQAETLKDKELFLGRVAGLRLNCASPQIAVFLTDDVEWIRICALEAAGSVGAGELAPQIRSLLESDSEGVKIGAIKAIGALGDRESIPKLLRFLNGEGPMVSHTLISMAKLDAQEAIPYMVRELFLKNGSRSVAAESLIRMKATRTIPDLINRLKTSSPLISNEATDVLAALGTRENFFAVTELLRDESSDARANGAMTLAKGRQRSAVPSIRALLWDAIPLVQECALRALTMLDARESAHDIVPFLDSPNASLRNVAGACLIAFEAGDVGDDIARFLKSESPDTRATAIQILATLRASKHLPSMVPLLNDPNISVRHAAIRALGTLGDRSVAPQLLAIGKANETSSIEALRILGRLDASDCVPDLLSIVRESPPAVAGAAAAALARLGSIEGIRIYFERELEVSRGCYSNFNRIREPEIWIRLKEQTLKENLEGPTEEVIQRLCALVNLKLERQWSSPTEVSPIWGLSIKVTCLRGQATLLEALDQVVDITGLEYVLDRDRLVITDQKAAGSLWKEWWSSRK